MFFFTDLHQLIVFLAIFFADMLMVLGVSGCLSKCVLLKFNVISPAIYSISAELIAKLLNCLHLNKNLPTGYCREDKNRLHKALYLVYSKDPNV